MAGGIDDHQGFAGKALAEVDAALGAELRQLVLQQRGALRSHDLATEQGEQRQ
ncbi:hypothetical protein D3C80_2020090 [compost metagenome]